MEGSSDEKAEVVPNKKVVLRRHVTGFPTVEDMEIVADTVELRVPAGLTAVLIKNLYLSCDPWMRERMTRHDDADALLASDFVVGEVYISFSIVNTPRQSIGVSESDMISLCD